MPTKPVYADDDFDGNAISREKGGGKKSLVDALRELAAQAFGGENSESGIATFNATQDYVDVVFTTPFSATTYKFDLSVYASDTEGPITAFIATKTKTGMRITPSAQFTGEVSWRAWL